MLHVQAPKSGPGNLLVNQDSCLKGVHKKAKREKHKINEGPRSVLEAVVYAFAEWSVEK